jgi:hypothetical protein
VVGFKRARLSELGGPVLAQVSDEVFSTHQEAVIAMDLFDKVSEAVYAMEESVAAYSRPGQLLFLFACHHALRALRKPLSPRSGPRVMPLDAHASLERCTPPPNDWLFGGQIFGLVILYANQTTSQPDDH